MGVMKPETRLSAGPPPIVPTRRRLRSRVAPAPVRRVMRRRLALWRLRGDEVECPCCERSFAALQPDSSGQPICPSCDSHARHRLLAYYVRSERPQFSSVLHFAPERAVEKLFRRPGVRYLSCDIDAPQADVHADIQDLPFDDGEFDLIVCSHVLEHVPDDRRATRELLRVLRPGGTALILVPLDPGRERTYEDPSITDPAERQRHFRQADHLRLYGNDTADRLREDGFEVRIDRYVRTLDERVAERHKMWSPGMFVVVRP